MPFVRASSGGPGSIVVYVNGRPGRSIRSGKCGLFGRDMWSLREAVCEHSMRWGAGAAGCEPTYVGEWNCATEAHDRAEMSVAANRKKANCNGSPQWDHLRHRRDHFRSRR